MQEEIRAMSTLTAPKRPKQPQRAFSVTFSADRTAQLPVVGLGEHQEVLSLGPRRVKAFDRQQRIILNSMEHGL
jgi:hypothetical protein